MDLSDPDARAAILDSPVTVPDTVVSRQLASETIVLDVSSGLYHGLNTTAAAMFAALRSAGTPRRAADQLMATLPGAGEELERDLAELCVSLARRGLIELRDLGP